MNKPPDHTAQATPPATPENICVADEAGIRRAVELLRAGEVVALPTETVYGLGGDALNPAALARIFAVKQRPLFDPLILHVASVAEAESLVTSFPDQARALAQAFWPGPLTLVLPKAATVPDLATSGLPHVAIRVPAHPVMREVLRQFGGPIAAPSANKFQSISPTTTAAVARELGIEVPCILDGGPCAVGLESTIVGWDEEGRPSVLRTGGVALEEIERVIGPLQQRNAAVSEGHQPQAPGQLALHYAPRKELVLAPNAGQAAQYSGSDAAAGRSLGLLVLGPEQAAIAERHGERFERVLQLSADGNLIAAAARFFSALRELDEDPSVRIIVAVSMPHHGLGIAINERLTRAAARNQDCA